MHFGFCTLTFICFSVTGITSKYWSLQYDKWNIYLFFFKLSFESLNIVTTLKVFHNFVCLYYFFHFFWTFLKNTLFACSFLEILFNFDLVLWWQFYIFWSSVFWKLWFIYFLTKPWSQKPAFLIFIFSYREYFFMESQCSRSYRQRNHNGIHQGYFRWQN